MEPIPTLCATRAFFCHIYDLHEYVREGCGKSKWKFKMAFAMKGGGVSRGSRVPHTYFEK